MRSTIHRRGRALNPDRAGLMDEAAMLDFTVEVVRKIEGQTKP